jgi:hypothetical protein
MQDDIEGCILMIGTVDFLDKPGSYNFPISFYVHLTLNFLI